MLQEEDHRSMIVINYSRGFGWERGQSPTSQPRGSIGMTGRTLLMASDLFIDASLTKFKPRFLVNSLALGSIVGGSWPPYSPLFYIFPNRDAKKAKL